MADKHRRLAEYFICRRLAVQDVQQILPLAAELTPYRGSTVEVNAVVESEDLNGRAVLGNNGVDPVAWLLDREALFAEIGENNNAAGISLGIEDCTEKQILT